MNVWYFLSAEVPKTTCFWSSFQFLFRMFMFLFCSKVMPDQAFHGRINNDGSNQLGGVFGLNAPVLLDVWSNLTDLSNYQKIQKKTKCCTCKAKETAILQRMAWSGEQVPIK